MASPRFIVISGAPATGKSTIARQISEAFGIPLVAKDRIKEAMFDTLGIRDRAWSKRLGGAAMRLLYDAAADHLRVGSPVVLESNFKPALDTAPLVELARRHGARTIQVYCRADDAVRLERIRGRVRTGERHPGHDDTAYLREGDAVAVATVEYGAMTLDGPCYEIDTSDFSKFSLSELLDRLAI